MKMSQEQFDALTDKERALLVVNSGVPVHWEQDKEKEHVMHLVTNYPCALQRMSNGDLVVAYNPNISST